MALYAISDLHLSLSTDKSMEAFGGRWINYVEKIEEKWWTVVSAEDTVVICGDHSWGRNLSECEKDLQFIEHLPGRKILLRGNHDMFWDPKKTAQLNSLYEPKLHFLQNNFFPYEDYALVGTKGYTYEGIDEPEHAEKLVRRELDRLRISFEAAKAEGFSKFIMCLHYPPTSMLWPGLCSRFAEDLYENAPAGQVPDLFVGKYVNADVSELPSGFTEMAEEYGAEQVIYGHCHGTERSSDSIRGVMNGVKYRLVSGDFLDFKPVRILP